MKTDRCYYCEGYFPEAELEYFSVGRLLCKDCVARGRARD
jgi:hypothetical protein